VNPYLLSGPALISFSGGRTSRYMLKHILDANGGLPRDVHVVFANTGKEDNRTLDFVHRVETDYCPITWLEFDPEEPHRTKIVDHNSANRDGRPYEMLIDRRSFLPNPVMRFCTIELKIRRFAMYAQHWLGFEHWTSVVGLRADEPRRVEKLEPRNAENRDRWKTTAPLAAAGVVKNDVLAWSAAQPFDLELSVDEDGDTVLGNCDLCFLKGRQKLEKIIAAQPDRADWWVEQESRQEKQPSFQNLRNPDMAKFRADRPSYAAMRSHAVWIKGMKDARDRKAALRALPDDDGGDCFCTD